MAVFDKDAKGLRLIGHGQYSSHGYKAGRIVDVEALEHAILNAVQNAEESCEELVRSVIVNISGSDILSEHVDVGMDVRSHEIDEDDLHHLLDPENLMQGVSGYQILHAMPLGFSIDGQHGIKDPRGLIGQQLKAKIHAITVPSSSLQSMKSIMRRCHLNPVAFCLSSLASGYSCLVEDEMNLGVTLIDIGAGLTDIAVFSQGEMVHSEVIPIGGNHITNDLAKCLSTPIKQAERLKVLYGSAFVLPGHYKEVVKVPQMVQDHYNHEIKINRNELVEIMQARLEEMFAIIAKRLLKSPVADMALKRFVLTGGMSLIPGINELMTKMYKKQVRLGRPLHVYGVQDVISSRAFSTSAGLLSFLGKSQQYTQSEMQGFWKQLRAWFRETF